MFVHVNVSCVNSFVFINEDHRFLQSRMLSTFRHTHGSYSNMFCPSASTTDRSFSRKALSLTSQAWNYNSQQPRPTLSFLSLMLPCREHQNQYSHGLRPVCMLYVNILTSSGSVLFVCIWRLPQNQYSLGRWVGKKFDTGWQRPLVGRRSEVATQ